MAMACWAQYPARPIRIVVPIPPGGAPDVAARVLGQALAEPLGVVIIIEIRLQRQHRRGIRRPVGR